MLLYTWRAWFQSKIANCEIHLSTCEVVFGEILFQTSEKYIMKESRKGVGLLKMYHYSLWMQHLKGD
ncbi:hypothetical protein FRX31_008817 [Thalictrum thalictroides]|uniref:Uncharacterized protein n=1 Tax=Thalictrum thalictroides TaxID=46969 RepID=A0A7J6WW22_THATH|nr:hypothetical protein FRX31_008817 [Thalictrum thalictroides]